MSKRPEVRFKGYTDNWERSLLGNVADVYDGVHQTPDYKASGVMFLSVENIATLTSEKYISEEAFLRDFKTFPEKGDVLMTRIGDVGTPNVVETSEKLAYYVSLALLKPNGIDPYYLCNAIQSIEFRKGLKERTLVTAIPQKINKDEIGKIGISYPTDFAEQQLLGECLRRVNELIRLHQRKYDKLLTYKKAMLEKMFPKDGADVPEVRFAGFTKPWQHLNFGGDIVLPYSDPVATPNGGYERLGIRSHAKGTFHSFVPAGQELETAQMHRVRANNFIVNITFGWEHAVAITDAEDEGKLVSHRFPQFAFNQGMVPSFFKYQIIDEKFRHHLWLSSPGGAGRNRVLNTNQMLEYKFWVTEEAEQTKIANFFTHLDDMIGLQHERLTRIKNIKKALLNKMFI